ncbi:hypothetical protein A3C87_02680 [Candidatus Kaiserbacteria bacterium RIFCSPHIGHO2_02_FULL_49_34]|uniref:RNase H type-1 domain-containing protein n=1 Tax=Candidatus Kaiserbacteria bacterium RIFCSPHIGHO2_02_FULL_49_34 TaxID=1798491 RepID=A0A1F6DKK6_9BACT|nr:MAG: hypothetical protein A3C87_02680 [Candidatus Kaiserbacteria bacterium RIFCSPHIGHO2_02_FULL_49_34]
MKKIIAYTDGGSRGNPGPSGLGVYITNVDGDMLAEVSKYLGVATNNHAEYEAVLVALETLHAMFADETKKISVEIRLDSQLVQRQMDGIYKVKSPELRIQFEKIKALQKEHFPHLTFQHVYREFNKDADRLANDAMDRKA